MGNRRCHLTFLLTILINLVLLKVEFQGQGLVFIRLLSNIENEPSKHVTSQKVIALPAEYTEYLLFLCVSSKIC